MTQRIIIDACGWVAIIDAGINFEIELEHSDDNATFTDVTSNTDVTGGTVGTNGLFQTIDANGDCNAVYAIGYVGGKRYSRVVLNFSGTHGIGHTRMATETAITTDGSHPYSTGKDECLVHNGSLSNHNNLRRELVKKGNIFNSENDTEVAAGYVSNSLLNKKSLKDTLVSGLKDLDGFYTFITGTKKGFAVVRDEIACKPAVIAETKNYVAIASEFQAMAHLPDVNSAKIFEPEPGIVYSWGN